MSKELRFNAIRELRVAQENGKQSIEGYAAMFNSPSEDLGGFREVIKPGAFKRAIAAKQDVRALINHDPNQVLGRTKAGTLQLSEDEKGLKFRCELPDTSYARDLAASMTRGDIDQCSFGFSAVSQRWTNTNESPEYQDMLDEEENCMVRELHDCDLFDVSPVTYPAYPETSVAMRSLTNAFEHRAETPTDTPEPVTVRSIDPDGDGDDDSAVIEAIMNAAEACEAFAELCEQACEQYTPEQLSSVVTEAKKIVAMVEKAQAAAETEVSEDSSESERMRMQCELASLL